MFPAAKAGEETFFTLAWEGPRAGECNDDTIPLSQLQLMHKRGLIPGDVLVWPKSQHADDGTMWRTVDEVLAELAAPRSKSNPQ
eukprot:4207493-Prymnesium_polylepis.1